jgi:RNA polymerase sigma-70 factor (ECF subfamily)
MQDMRDELAGLGNGAHALAIQILGNREDAADAVHDAFAQVLARPQAWDRRRGPLRPWFLRVVRNRCIDLLRRRRTPAGLAVEQLADPGKPPDAVLEARQRDEGLMRALALLRPEQRQILVLRDYADLGYAEIADVLDLAPGTVMSRLHRARTALRAQLEEDDDD